MKKYIIGLVVLSLFIIPSLSLAQISDVDPNPTASDCVSLQSSGLRYRSRDANTNGEVSLLQDFLQTKGYLNSEPTGYFGILTLKAVKDFQKDSGITPTGYVGAITKAKISSLTGCDGTIIITTPISKSNPVISGVSGPQSLKVGEQGTWTVNASDNSNPGSSGNLTYSVNWGDTGVVICRSGTSCATAQSSQQSATFTHTYNTAGTYNPTFTVIKENTIMCFTTPCPGNGGSAKTSLSVKVGDLISTNHSPVLNPIVTPVNTADILVGQSVNFAFSATDADNDNLTWIVNWGDSNTGDTPGSCGVGQIGGGWKYNLSHTWNTVGTYNAKVTVSDCKGGTASRNFIITVVGNVATPSITVLSPNGGTLISGQAYNISWRGSGNFDSYQLIIGNTITNTERQLYDKVSSVGFIPKAQTSVVWNVPLSILDDFFPYGVTTSNNFYIKVNAIKQDNAGYEILATSKSNLFYITSSDNGCSNGEVYSSTTGQKCSGPTISGISGPQTLNVNQTGTWTVKASDPNSIAGGSGNLTYSVNWGDLSVVCPSGISCATAQSSQQSATFTHSYSNSGTYYPTFTVTNTSGQSAKTSLSVKVGDITVSINHNPILNPIVFTTDMNVGKSYNFNFSATDPDNDNLSWVISWGDNDPSGSTTGGCPVTSGKTWGFNTNHTWRTAGLFYVKVTVSDCKGGTASSNLNINIIGSTPVTFLGDVNGDGLVTCDDSSMILKSVTGSIILTAEQKKRADMDGNGVVQSYDSALLMQKNNLSCSATS